MLGKYNNVPLTNTYQISSIINHSFPEKLPSVFENSKLIPSGFTHFMLDGSLCLGTETAIRERLVSSPELLYFFQEFVNQYFYSVRYYEFYHCFPFGESAHGADGIVNFYKTKFNVQTRSEVIDLLEGLTNLERLQHGSPCPCGSGKRLSLCHGSQLFTMINSPLCMNYLEDIKALRRLK